MARSGHELLIGLLPDESRTNVYKLYRATRTGPDSIIEPSKQLAFYVPGIGTPAPRHNTLWDRTKETVRQMFGFGLTEKIVDCYVAIVGVWQPGDRIYLFGFSRGAYTARCVSHVLEVYGIPTKQPNGQSLNLDPKSIRKVAAAAVRCLYTFGMPISKEKTVDARVEKFRKDYGSQTGADMGATAFMIGIWDAVAAIGWQRFSLIGFTIATSRRTFDMRATFNRSTRAAATSSACRGVAAAQSWNLNERMNQNSSTKYGSREITQTLAAATRRMSLVCPTSHYSGWSNSSRGKFRSLGM